MRVVAGTAGGRRLAVPPGQGTRPTSDRVREALFSRLEAWGAVEGAVVLDLFCGSGALALEALSRGAVRADGVEQDRRAADVARRNATDLRLPLTVHRADAARWSAAAPDGGYGLVLLDPPYAVAEDALAGLLNEVARLAAPGAVVVVERSRRSPEPGWPTGLAAGGSRDYGETRVWFADATDATGDREPPP
ncbi:16S rRNA (guanine(966)-N(2))-methyltransferase RsmD [Aquipuribacter sp. SD81]|uniref:16S rRNA (guanine(966)-N(2))-methyltransferase RsmD n=1 Tax=Aquipuribacter sp. SD81 TaxID=3127703 RepID=UPI00301647EA